MRNKNSTALLEYCQRIVTSFQTLNKHIKELERNGEWKLGNLYFDAVAMQLEVITEYVCKILDNTGDFGKQLPYVYPEVPWSQIHRFRQLLAHWYIDKIVADDVRDILANALPHLIEAIKKIQASESP